MSDDPWPSLAVVVPVYNEAAGIEKACREIAGVLGAYPGRAVLIAVDDGSSDESASLLERMDEVDLVRHEANKGYGAALRTGASRAKELGLEYLAFIDSDLTNPPGDLLRIGELAREGHSYVKASRFVAGGRMEGVPRWRQLVSRTGNLVASKLFGTAVRDVTNGFRAGRTELICSWPTREPGFAVIVEELSFALAAGVSVVEFPTVLSSRSTEQRSSAFTYSPALLWSYLRYPLRAWVHRHGRHLP